MMTKYLDKVQTLTLELKYFGILHIPRCKNAWADTLSWLATLADRTLYQTYLKYLETPIIEEAEEVQQVNHELSWINRFVKKRSNGTIYNNPPEGKKFKWKAFKYLLLDGQLHRKSFSFSLLKYLPPYKANYVLRDIHEGICRNHLEARSFAYKALR